MLHRLVISECFLTTVFSCMTEHSGQLCEAGADVSRKGPGDVHTVLPEHGDDERRRRPGCEIILVVCQH